MEEVGGDYTKPRSVRKGLECEGRTEVRNRVSNGVDLTVGDEIRMRGK